MSTSDLSARTRPLLFDSKVRVLGGVPATASAYERLDLAKPEMYEHARALLEAWFAQLPAHAKDTILGRFRNANDDAAHWGSFFELYLHALAAAAGWKPEIDAGRESQLDRRPDLRFLLPTGPCAVEARTVRGDDVVAPDARPRVSQLKEAISTLKHTNHHLLHVDLLQVGDGSPPKALKHELEEWLGSLDPDADLDRGARCRTFDCAVWRFNVEASPICPELRGRPDMRRARGTWCEGFAGHEHVITGERTIKFDGPRPLDDASRIAAAITKKRKHRYQVDDEPFVLALMCRGDFADDDAVAEALFGPDVWGTSSPSSSRRAISAVLTLTELRATSVAISSPTMWANPHADRPLPPDAFPFRRFDVGADGRLDETPERLPIAPLLGIDPQFPGRPAWPAE